jgi:hypothetical protein
VARKRPTASDESQIAPGPNEPRRVGAAPDGADALTYAQARALRRCSPLSHSEFKAQRQVLAQQHRLSVMRIVRHAGDDNPRRAG